MSAAGSEDLAKLGVLILTSRDSYRLASYGMVIDFEDAVARLSDADLLQVPLRSRRAQLEAAARGRPLRSLPAPRSKYGACLLVAMGADWLPSLRFVRDLRETADRVIVYLFDSWVSDLPKLSSNRRVWELVDDLFVSFSHSLDAYASALPCRVHHLPQAADPRWFHARRIERPIDLLSVGRRLPEVHRHLRALSDELDLLYHYQTDSAPQVIDFYDNQALLGRLCQSSRVHVNWAVDRTSPRRRDEGSAITARWFESAASGAVVIGSPPAGEEFARLFPLPGFVREIDGEQRAATRDAVQAAFNDDRRQERVALADHVRTAHTWEARWREIVTTCGL